MSRLSTGSSSTWYLDSACCNHMTSNSSIFTTTTQPAYSPIVYTADNSIMHVQHVGSVQTSSLSVPDVFQVPQVSLNLLSVGQLCELGIDVLFSSRGCFLQDSQTRKILGTGCKVG